jgi:hypothetical protein
LQKGWCAFGTTCKFNHPEIDSAAILRFPESNAFNGNMFGMPVPGSSGVPLPVYYQLGGGQQQSSYAMPVGFGAGGGGAMFRQPGNQGNGYVGNGHSQYGQQHPGHYGMEPNGDLNKAMQSLRMGGGPPTNGRK